MSNGELIRKNVIIKYSTQWGWEKPPICSWQCKNDYIFEGGKCINSKMVSCKPIRAPKNSTLEWGKPVEITYSSNDGWSNPQNCPWNCDKNYTSEDGESCISTKSDKCFDIEHPENSHLVDKFYQVYYSSKWGWGKPKKCSWECDENFTLTEDKKSCIHEKKVPCTPITPPQNSQEIKENVTIKFTTGKGWSSPDYCKWSCDENYYEYKEVCIPFDIALTSGGDFNCSLKYDHTVTCWGDNQFGQIGVNRNEKTSKYPAKVNGLKDIIQIDSGWRHSCALNKSGKVFCWGDNGHGQVGFEKPEILKEPKEIPDLENIVKIALGWRHSCALNKNGEIFCWGRNFDGQIGHESKENLYSPYKNEHINDIVDIFAGGFHTIVQVKDGSFKSWGFNQFGQLGDGTLTKRVLPTKIQSNIDIKHLSIGDFHNCFINSEELYCWGKNDFGQLLNNTLVNESTPKKIKFNSKVENIKAGYGFTLILDSNKKLYLVGKAVLLNESIQRKRDLIFVTENKRVIDISAGENHACLLLNNGRTLCFGKNSLNQIGSESEKFIKEPKNILPF